MAYEELEKRISKLENRSQSSKIIKSTKYLEQEIMSDRERLIFNYILENPGNNKEDVRRYFHKQFARDTSRNILKSLKDKELIISKPNKENRQTLALFINHRNIILNVDKEIKEFKNNLLLVLDRLDDGINSGKIDVSSNQYQNIVDILRQDYFQFISIYFFRAILQWHKNIHDEQKLIQLYTILIKSIIDIQERISKFVLGYVPAIPFDKEICTDDDEIPNQINTFSNIGIKKEYESLKSSLIKINSDYSKDRTNLLINFFGK